MKGEDFNIPGNKKRVLVAPLDWGLGHVTRCIPVISKLQEENCEVIVAASGAGKFLLEKEFPGLHFIHLAGYQIKYSHKKYWMPVKLALQIPKLLWRVYSERRWLKKTVRQYHIDAVISDNRLGLSCAGTPSVYITHQLAIKTGSHFWNKLAQKIHYHYINKFSTCWVPDAEGAENLAGELSHPEMMPKTPVIYIGPLSRFEKINAAQKYQLCIMLSGPEPQRSIFEKRLLQQLESFSGSTFLLRGLPGNCPQLKSDLKNLTIENHLPAAALSQVLQQSALVISRSGYTTVMDLVKLGKKAILVPTPAQTEQEYLARYLQEQQLFYSLEQYNFSLKQAIQNSYDSDFVSASVQQDHYLQVVEVFVQQLHNDV